MYILQIIIGFVIGYLIGNFLLHIIYKRIREKRMDEATRMLFFKLDGFYTYLKPFLILLRRMPDAIYMVGNHDIVYSSDIVMDPRIIEELRKI